MLFVIFIGGAYSKWRIKQLKFKNGVYLRGDVFEGGRNLKIYGVRCCIPYKFVRCLFRRYTKSSRACSLKLAFHYSHIIFYCNSVLMP